MSIVVNALFSVRFSAPVPRRHAGGEFERGPSGDDRLVGQVMPEPHRALVVGPTRFLARGLLTTSMSHYRCLLLAVETATAEPLVNTMQRRSDGRCSHSVIGCRCEARIQKS